MSGRTVRKAAATLTAAFTLASAGVLASSTSASAATCYDGASYFSGENYYYPSSGTYATTSRCNDINVKIANLLITPNRKVKVCFYPSSAPAYCQGSYTTVDSDWTVVATDVLDGTRYRLLFENNSWVQAYRAA
ncbi:hypothetical protein [Streptomyces sp. NPDC050263]|uniref:hypothetical protein n=1 Tax=Streptomyces sp. NPDC050263 TaxID=3155037 RepID=UPI0034430309